MQYGKNEDWKYFFMRYKITNQKKWHTEQYPWKLKKIGAIIFEGQINISGTGVFRDGRKVAAYKFFYPKLLSTDQASLKIHLV